MFLPRALQLRTIDSSDAAAAVGKSMTTPDVAPLIVAYLRKRGLTKTLKTFVAETSLNLKEIGGPLEDDLDEIYGSYLSAKSTPEKRKIHSGASKSPVKKKKVKLTENVEKATVEPVKQKVDAVSKVNPLSPSSSEDSESSSGEEQGNPQTTAAKVSEKRKSGASNGVSKQVGLKTAPITDDGSSSDESDSEKKISRENLQSTVPSRGKGPTKKQELAKSVVKPTLASSSEDSESDSEEEADAVTTVAETTQKITSNVKNSSSREGLPTKTTAKKGKEPSPVKATLLKVKKTATKAEGESLPTKKPTAKIDKETSPVGTTAKIMEALPVKTTVKKKKEALPGKSTANAQGEVRLDVRKSSTCSSSSSESDSSSDEERQPTAKKVISKPPAKVRAKAANLKKASSSSSSSDSDSSSKEGAQALKIASKGPSPVGLKVQESKNLPSSSSSSEDSDPRDKEVTKVTKVISKTTEKSGTQAPKPPSLSVESSSDDSDLSEDIADGVVLAGKQVPSKPVVNQASASTSKVLEQERKALNAVAKGLEKSSNGKSKAVTQQTTLLSTDGTAVVEKVKTVKTKVMAPSKETSSSSEESGDDAKGEPAKKPNTPPLSEMHNSNGTHLLTKEPSGTKRKRGSDQQGEVEKSTTPQKRNGTKVSSKDDQGKPAATGEKSESAPKRQRLSQGAGKEGGSKYFQKINVNEVKYADPRLQDNSYWAKNGADEGWGAKAQMVLQNVRGKGFRHEKTKKKRGSYKGGSIDFSSHSIKFQDSDDE